MGSCSGGPDPRPPRGDSVRIPGDVPYRLARIVAGKTFVEVLYAIRGLGRGIQRRKFDLPLVAVGGYKDSVLFIFPRIPIITRSALFIALDEDSLRGRHGVRMGIGPAGGGTVLVGGRADFPSSAGGTVSYLFLFISAVLDSPNTQIA